MYDFFCLLANYCFYYLDDSSNRIIEVLFYDLLIIRMNAFPEKRIELSQTISHCPFPQGRRRDAVAVTSGRVSR